MAKLQELKKYLNYEFSTGVYTGEDYKRFERKYINYLKAMCNEYNMQLVCVHKNHYNFTACFKRDNKYAYFSISDVRYYKNDWYYNILIRTMKHAKDYTGGSNRYTDLERLPMSLDCLFQGM